jgi:hypothetical protein
MSDTSATASTAATATPADVLAAADGAAAKVAKKADLPAKLQLTAPYGFIDENDRARNWRAGDIITDPAEIALLIDRVAPVDFVD